LSDPYRGARSATWSKPRTWGWSRPTWPRCAISSACPACGSFSSPSTARRTTRTCPTTTFRTLSCTRAPTTIPPRGRYPGAIRLRNNKGW